MKDLVVIKEQNIQNKIYTLRGLQVMLDKDLAELYDVKPTRLREQIKRNIERFPEDFMFQLTLDEVDGMVSQNAIPSKQHLGGSLPYVFTEQGVANISSVLTSKIAIEMNIKIMRAFVTMRRFISQNGSIFQRLDALDTKIIQHKMEYDEKFDQLFTAIENKSITSKQGIFYDGEIFDAYIFISDILRKAQTSVILIDNYVDETVLTQLSSKTLSTVKISILTKKISKELQLDLQKHNAQYPSIKATEFPYSHDRFLIIDQKEIYHLGASLKDLGKKWFAFSLLEINSLSFIDKIKDFA